MSHTMDVMLIHSELLGLLGENLFVGHDNGDGSRVVRVRVDHDVSNDLATTVDSLELLERDVFTTLHLDEVLDTVNDLEMTIGVKLANVSSLEPTVGSESLLGLFGVIIILSHDGLSANENLTLRGGSVG